MTTKIAVPTREGVIDDHFGHCAYYTIYSIENNVVVEKQTLPSPQGCGCKSNIAYELRDMGVTVMLAGNMGAGALNKLNSCNIRVVRGCKGDIDNVVNAYLSGNLVDSGIGCSSHDEHHQCHNH